MWLKLKREKGKLDVKYSKNERRLITEEFVDGVIISLKESLNLSIYLSQTSEF